MQQLTRRRLQRASAALCFAAGGVLIGLNGCATPLRIDPVGTTVAPLVTDTHLELARAYAPWIYHAAHPEEGRQDVPTRVDYDGNLRGDDNWETLPRFALPPTVYYAVLETETHYFLTYHLFHPRDYSYVRIGVHEEHENDGENLQVVVDKASGKVVLLTTQAHYFGYAYANQGGGFTEAEECFEAGLLLVDADGKPSESGKHAAVYVQWGGHGIYGALDSSSGVTVGADGKANFDGHGYVLRPALAGEPVSEPDTSAGGEVAYQLESTVAKLWPGVRDGSLLGEGGLLDGTVQHESRLGTHPVPRYYEGDRFSGPFGPDRGIAPFALDFSFGCDTVGALFYDPAGRYPQVLGVPEPWSLNYLGYPFER